MNKKIAEYTGQLNIANQILDSNSNCMTHIIESDSGMGKTTLCKYIENEWSNSISPICFTLRASQNNYHEELAPFFDAFMEYNRYTPDVINNIIKESSKDIPLFGNTISSILTAVFNNKEITIKDYNSFSIFSDQEKYILKIIETFIEGANALFICEDIDKWDSCSLRLLNFLLAHQINRQSFNNITYVVTNTNKNIKLYPDQGTYYSLKNIDKQDIHNIIYELTPQFALDEFTEEFLYVLTGGNLELIIECCSILDLNKDDINDATIYDIVCQRIRKNTVNYKQIIKLLKMSSVIGYRFKRELLKHFSQSEISDYESTLSETFEMKMLKDNTYDITFTKDSIYKCFYDSLGKYRKKYHLKLEESLKLITPALYETRAYNLLSAEDLNNAVKLYIIHLLRYLRENGREMVVQNELYKNVKGHSYYSFYKKMCIAYRYYFEGEFNQANVMLIEIDTDVLEFIFEIDYLYALICTNEKYTISEFEYGIERLKKWDYSEFRELHSEMWLRVAFLLLDYEYEMDIQPSGKNRLNCIQRLLDAKSLTDNVMKDRKYHLFLKSNVYSKIEIAYHYTKKALQYFSPKNRFNITSYYISLLNHSSNELVMGEYNDSYNHTIDAINLVQQFVDTNFLKLEILINNHTVSGYLNNIYNSYQCIELLKQYIGTFNHFADELLINNNAVAFMALSEQYDQALSLSDELLNCIDNMDDVDVYYKYFIINNNMIINYLLGNKGKAEDLLNKIVGLIPLSLNKYYFISRNKYIYQLLKNTYTIDTTKDDWNDLLIKKYPNTIGKAWTFWGKLLLFSDLQTWSDC